MNSPRVYTGILLILILLELIFSVFLALNSQQDAVFCGFESSCYSVQNSPYGSILGIKVTWFGVIAFTLLLASYILALFRNYYYRVFIALCLLGALFSIYFLFVQFFILKHLCSNCIIIDLTMLLIFYIAVTKKDKLIKNPKFLGQ